MGQFLRGVNVSHASVESGSNIELKKYHIPCLIARYQLCVHHGSRLGITYQVIGLEMCWELLLAEFHRI